MANRLTKALLRLRFSGELSPWLRRNETHPQMGDVERWLDQFNQRRAEEHEAANITRPLI